MRFGTNSVKVKQKQKENKKAKVFTRLAIPYNPYHPEPYERWTLKGLYDLEKGEILVGEEFLNFVASDNIYEELLDVFQGVGEELREEIDEKFAEFRICEDDREMRVRRDSEVQ